MRNGNREITVNVLLDDGSTKNCINSDVATELGLDRPVENVTVSNEKWKALMEKSSTMY